MKGRRTLSLTVAGLVLAFACRADGFDPCAPITPLKKV
jgi:hypothetical protein